MAKIVQLKDNLSKENLYPITLASEVIKGGTSIVPSLLPEGGTVGDVLSNNGETNSWENISNMFQGIEELLYYGVEIDSTISDPHLTRVGNMDLHRSLPIQSKMKGCLLSDDGKVVEYLPEDDWTNSVRDGSKGQVMVEVPDHYRKFVTEGTKYRALISEYPLKGFHKVNKFYISAYEASLLRSTKKLSSVVNTSEDYRGGNNNAEWDGTYRSLLGVPVTALNISNFRTYARNRNQNDSLWNILVYLQYTYIYWLYVIEYANLNCLEDFIEELTDEGFKLGGLGSGITSVYPINLGNYNNYNPFITCGYTDSLGNRSGIVKIEISFEDIVVLKDVPRYRGIENIFGHINTLCDGILAITSISEENGGDGLQYIYILEDPLKFENTSSNYNLVGSLSKDLGYIVLILGGSTGYIFPKISTGGSSTTYFCDYYTRVNSSNSLTTNTIHVTGGCGSNLIAGLSNIQITGLLYSAPSDSGTRLCYIPKLN